MFAERSLTITIIAIALAFPLRSRDANVRAQQFRELMQKSPRLPLTMTDFRVQPPSKDWAIEFVSSLTVDQDGVIYLFQRGLKADPIIAVNREGKILRSWGRGMFKIPHSIRVDPVGDIWTADAAISEVRKFTREGKPLLKIEVGGLPANPASEFCGTTDIAFAGNRIFISDGYANARVLEYRPNGELVRQWGKPGMGPGEFHLPHAIAIDEEKIIYVADRENGRIQRFDLEGKFLGEWTNLGKTFSMTITRSGELWIGTQPHNVANGVEPWLVKLDRHTGKILGVIQSGGHHSVDLNADGEPMTGARPDKILRFRPTSH